MLSVDGIGFFDLVSRGPVSGLLEVEGGASALPFVRQFHGSPSTYLWDDDDGVTHEIAQGEGGEQGDALMPLLFSHGLISVRCQRSTSFSQQKDCLRSWMVCVSFAAQSGSPMSIVFCSGASREDPSVEPSRGVANRFGRDDRSGTHR